eukprot:1430105-Pleurochrysis_carterae.AAC.1
MMTMMMTTRMGLMVIDALAPTAVKAMAGALCWRFWCRQAVGGGRQHRSSSRRALTAARKGSEPIKAKCKMKCESVRA